MNGSTQLLAAALSAASFATSPTGAASPGTTAPDITLEETRECRSTAAAPSEVAPLSSAQIESLVIGTAQAGNARTATDIWAGLRQFTDATTRRRVDGALSAHQPMYLKWQLFLDDLPRHDERITVDHVDAARAVLAAAADGEKRLPAATTEINEDGSLFLAWSSADHFLEISVHPDGRFSWFYRDRQARTHAGTNGALISEISPELREVLWLFLV